MQIQGTARRGAVVGRDRRTADTPAAAIVVVNVHDDGTNNEPSDVSDGIEKTETPARRKVEVFLPRVERLETADKGAVILISVSPSEYPMISSWTYSRSGTCQRRSRLGS